MLIVLFDFAMGAVCVGFRLLVLWVGEGGLVVLGDLLGLLSVVSLCVAWVSLLASGCFVGCGVSVVALLLGLVCCGLW